MLLLMSGIPARDVYGPAAALRHLQMPFEVGEEVTFKPNGQVIEGIVIDVGWYR